jgi:hypothetical protein
MSKLTFRVLFNGEAIAHPRHASSGEVKGSETLWVRLSATLILVTALFLAAITGVAAQCGQPNQFCYSGEYTLTGKTADLKFTIQGTKVIKGTLYCDSVCKEDVHLSGTDIKFTGTVIGGNWEGLSTTINGQWTGGEWICDPSNIIKNDPNFPNQGILTIYMTQDKDGKHIILDKQRGEYYYIFGPSGRTYVPSGAIPGGITGQGGAIDLTGKWSCSLGGDYYIRQLGNTIMWYGELAPINPIWSNTAYGTINGGTISLVWADVPKGTNALSGSLTLEVSSNDELKIIDQTGGWGGDLWKDFKLIRKTYGFNS